MSNIKAMMKESLSSRITFSRIQRQDPYSFWITMLNHPISSLHNIIHVGAASVSTQTQCLSESHGQKQWLALMPDP